MRIEKEANEDYFLNSLYKIRFSDEEVKQKNKIWKVLCKSFFQRYIDKEAVVLDIGSGRGEFINNICCKQKYAIDANKENAQYLSSEVNFFEDYNIGFDFLSDNSVDLIFISNFAEHAKSKEELLGIFFAAKRILKRGGKFILLGPNIRFLCKEYWDFFDHYLPLSHKALVEVFKAMDFRIVKVIPKFLPYTTKSMLPKNAFLVWLYLKIPIIWRLMGKQMFILCEKS